MEIAFLAGFWDQYALALYTDEIVTLTRSMFDFLITLWHTVSEFIHDTQTKIKFYTDSPVFLDVDERIKR